MPSASRPEQTTTDPHGPVQPLPLALGLGTFVFIAIRLASDGWRMATLWLIGGLLGLTLYHASFGFASAYRRMIVARDMRGVQAQLLMLALAVVLFAPALAAGSAFGRELGGTWAPLGVAAVLGHLATLLVDGHRAARRPGHRLRCAYRLRLQHRRVFSGVASGSLHGWLWIAAALPGCWFGVKLRRRFGLAD
jgi:hypothetical protein